MWPHKGLHMSTLILHVKCSSLRFLFSFVLLSLVSLCDGTADAGFLLKRLYSTNTLLFITLLFLTAIWVILGEKLRSTTERHWDNFHCRERPPFELSYTVELNLPLGRVLVFVRHHLEFGLLRKMERDRDKETGGGGQRMSAHVFKICLFRCTVKI